MRWKKWSLWNFILRRLAKAQGFLDPMVLFSNLQRFSKPSEVWVPTELLRSGAVLQARGLINSQAIQHNLDWVWPMWVERQFNPKDKGFIPRAFSLTHINLTHRNWTAVGLPDFSEFPLVDPNGLVTPFFDGWSLDAWIIAEHKYLVPSRLFDIEQKLEMQDGLAVTTHVKMEGCCLHSRVSVNLEEGAPVCTISFKASSASNAWLVICPRPYNPEGVSFIRDIKRLEDREGWMINGKDTVYLNENPLRYLISNYERGDLYNRLIEHPPGVEIPGPELESVNCPVGMANAAALYNIKAHGSKNVHVRIPLAAAKVNTVTPWAANLHDRCVLKIPNQHFQYLFEAALRTLILHSPSDVYPGPYTYKRFWFRDAAFILEAMISMGLLKNIEKILDRFPTRQTPTGYFMSQDGEWDSNGQAIWAIHRFCQLTNTPVKAEWLTSVCRAAKWIQRKRLPVKSGEPTSGLLPAGFSAEHFGPNDFYYWDDFWSIAGLNSAADLAEKEYPSLAKSFRNEAPDLQRCVDQSLEIIKERAGNNCIPASPSRRMDSGAIGSLCASYPVQVFAPNDPRVLETVHFLIQRYLLNGCYYHEISHSGINAYLTLHIAQVLLRAGDPRFFDAVKSIGALASPTGQWPEAIHPRTAGGCMGDGQHVWAAAEWVTMMRNMFVREERQANTLILCSGIPEIWLRENKHLSMGPILTAYGPITVTITVNSHIQISWEAKWHGRPPVLEVHLPGHAIQAVPEGTNTVHIKTHELQESPV